MTSPSKPDRPLRSGRGVQVVVGHYNGNLPQEKLRNLTDEEINANNFNPLGWGEGGKAVRLTKEDERLSDETFGINQEAKGDVLTFLDSHCECTEGWLEPLLDRIKDNRRAVVCPVIDVINDRTFQYQKGLDMFRGGFNWNLQFRWYAMPSDMAKQRLVDPTSPIPSPTMAGGLFSIDRLYFEEIGTYDHGMDIWGGENLEISFRDFLSLMSTPQIWQCGGRVEILPCSHVGHIFRHASPHDIPGNSSGKVLDGNMVRVSEVWMDEWKFLFYKMAPQTGKLRNVVDMSERLELRRHLGCKDFRWYLENVFIDHHLPMEGDFFGRISLDTVSLCMVNRPGEPGTKKHQLNMVPCTLGFDHWQFWILTKDGHLKSDEHMCLSATQVVHTNGEWMVQLKECAGHDMELWDYNRQRRTFKHRKSGLCLTQRDPNMEKQENLSPPILTPCARGHEQQMWSLKSVNWRPEPQ
ncbi:Polypeptide N-acetylgalactosaminyltransferase [Trichostrongylus colubriformis]|uniref:Polypeptide N-acetylgalactosaminyltransferase n=1 Tax=Trichostrongylus colubriformis TaxID=6319 RepID=A0AAN8IEM8_TRICO